LIYHYGPFASCQASAPQNLDVNFYAFLDISYSIFARKIDFYQILEQNQFLVKIGKGQGPPRTFKHGPDCISKTQNLYEKAVL